MRPGTGYVESVNILVLGGTVFLGRHVVEAARAAGHAVTVLTRGLTQPDLFPDLERVHADRDGGLDVLAGRRWGAIVDTCGFVPRVVAQSVALSCQRYVFVSSVSVYADLSRPNDEDAPALPDPHSEDVAAHYGALKAACERVVAGVLDERATIVRPGLIGGPHDPTGRFTYWPVRVAEGGDVLAPAPADGPVQVIDARDLAAWIVHLAERGPGGVFNAVGPETTFGDALAAIRAAVGGDARFVWTDPARLTGVEPWSELPLWAPHAPGMLRTPNARALAAGLRLRPLGETAVDTLAWARTLTGDPPRQSDGRYRPRTLTREREAELLRR